MEERALPGGASIDDVVGEALSKLGTKDPGTVKDWEALAYLIAENSAKDELRRSTAYRKYRDAEGSVKEIPVDIPE